MTRFASTLTRYLVLLPIMSLFLQISGANAGDAEVNGKPARLFERGDTLSVDLTAPWRELVGNENFQGAYPARIEFTDERGRQESLDLTVGVHLSR